MHIIKNLLVPMILAMGLWGCSENSDAFFASDQNKKRYTPSYFYNEFLSCTTGPDYSEANLKTIIAKFNTLNLSSEIVWVGGYVPIEGNNRNKNGWLEIQWTSREAAQAGWELWLADEETQNWNEKSKGVLDCDNTNIFGYVTQFPAPESIELKSWSKFAAAEIACTFKAGKTKKDLAITVRKFIHWLEVSENDDAFSYGIYLPVGEDSADFYWFNWHSDLDSMARGNAYWDAEGEEVAAKLKEIATCDTPNLYNGAEFYYSDSWQ
jgi:hypothetical protein